MAVQGDQGGGKEEIKTHFMTREGPYKLMTLSEYSRPNRVAYNGQPKEPVKVSFITLHDNVSRTSDDRICFNVGKELYVYQYKGVRKAADLTKPIDKRMYKGTFPTCHDFNQLTATPDSVMLLVGFSAGQVQLIDPIKKELSKIYNEDRMIDKTKVTCIKWIPGSPNQFLVSHTSGQMYVYSEELICGPAPPHYQPFKQGEGFSVFTCKAKSTRNPLYRWVVGEGAISEFAFSPCQKYLAVVSEDGYLRVLNYSSMELVGSMKSYFGGLLCVCWSPDSKYIVVGGEDDLVAVWSVLEKRVVCRGQGHKSWVNVVAFDPYTTSVGDGDAIMDFSGSDDDFNHCKSNSLLQDTLRASTRSTTSKGSSKGGSSATGGDVRGPNIVSYRFGSVGQDTVMCLWDLTEDVLRQPFGRHRTSTVISQSSTPFANSTKQCNIVSPNSQPNSIHKDSAHLNNVDHHQATQNTSATSQSSSSSNVSSSFTQKFATLALGDRKEKDKDHKRAFSLGNRGGDKGPLLRSNNVKPADDALRLLGTPACPRMVDVPKLEPMVCKKVALERLTALAFREECIVTACQEGYVYTWARPGKVGLTQQHTLSSPPQSAVSTVL